MSDRHMQAVSLRHGHELFGYGNFQTMLEVIAVVAFGHVQFSCGIGKKCGISEHE
jgi:hypothetical protein